MSPIRSLGNRIASFRNRFGNTGTNAGPPLPFSATGGDSVITITGYKVHIFTTTGPSTFVVSGSPGPVEYLVVAGGGSGSAQYGGGGGAGGLRTNLSGHPLAGSALTLNVGTHPVIVGAGGEYATPPGEPGVPGADSTFGTITASGGGGGGGPGQLEAPWPTTTNGGPGGSGGGGAGRTGTYAPNMDGGAGNTPPSSPPQGNGGGDGYADGNRAGGGGGGAGAAGQNGGPNDAGNGGVGVQVLIAGNPSPIGTPGPGSTDGWFAGGGGGGGYNVNAGSGGAGGGGAGRSSPTAGVPGTANTGGGGGGGFHPDATTGGDGGSGIVVVRYPN